MCFQKPDILWQFKVFVFGTSGVRMRTVVILEKCRQAAARMCRLIHRIREFKIITNNYNHFHQLTIEKYNAFVNLE
jgi:hypothetical protein